MLKAKKNDGTQSAVHEENLIKNKRKREKPDFSLALLRFIIFAIAAMVVFGTGVSSWVYWSPANMGVRALILLVILLLVFSLRKANEWERIIVLRFGRFQRVQGPGLFFLIPVADRAAHTVDIRVRVTDFTAQETLTKDSVTVTVDAICFWLVWDPQKAILEVEDYKDAVILASKTALRDSVSSHDLSTFLERCWRD
jgi:hypothetical protein